MQSASGNCLKALLIEETQLFAGRMSSSVKAMMLARAAAMPVLRACDALFVFEVVGEFFVARLRAEVVDHVASVVS